MQGIAHLISTSVESYVTQRLPSQIRVNPKRKDSLGGLCELTSTCKYAATKRVIVRAIGPELAQYGGPNVLADPTLELA